jgi:hypothetical protein
VKYGPSLCCAVFALNLAGCATSWPARYVPVQLSASAQNLVPAAGTFHLITPKDDSSLDTFDAAMSVTVAMQPERKMVSADELAEYSVETGYSRRPAEVDVFESSAPQAPNASPRASFGCKRDVVELNVAITRSTDGVLVYAGRAQQFVCHGDKYDADRPALARAALAGK